MSKNFSIEGWKNQHLKNLLKENNNFVDSRKSIPIYNDGDHRLIIVWESDPGKISIVDDFNGEDWDVIWDTEDLRPELMKYIKNYKLPNPDEL